MLAFSIPPPKGGQTESAKMQTVNTSKPSCKEAAIEAAQRRLSLGEQVFAVRDEFQHIVSSVQAEHAVCNTPHYNRHELYVPGNACRLFVDFDRKACPGETITREKVDEVATVMSSLLGAAYLLATKESNVSEEEVSVSVYTSSTPKQISLHVVVDGPVYFASPKQVAITVCAALKDSVHTLVYPDKTGHKLPVDLAPYRSGSLRMLGSMKYANDKRRKVIWQPGAEWGADGAQPGRDYTQAELENSLVFFSTGERRLQVLPDAVIIEATLAKKLIKQKYNITLPKFPSERTIVKSKILKRPIQSELQSAGSAKRSCIQENFRNPSHAICKDFDQYTFDFSANAVDAYLQSLGVKTSGGKMMLEVIYTDPVTTCIGDFTGMMPRVFIPTSSFYCPLRKKRPQEQGASALNARETFRQGKGCHKRNTLHVIINASTRPYQVQPWCRSGNHDKDPEWQPLDITVMRQMYQLQVQNRYMKIASTE